MNESAAMLAKWNARLRAARGVGAFLGRVPKAADQALEALNGRKYDKCRTCGASLISEGIWLAFGQLAIVAANEIEALDAREEWTVDRSDER